MSRLIANEAGRIARRLRKNYREVADTWNVTDSLLSDGERMNYSQQLRDLEIMIFALERISENDLSGQCGNDAPVASGN